MAVKRTKEELAQIKAVGGVGDTPIKKIVVPSDTERKAKKTEEKQEQEKLVKKAELPAGIRIAGKKEPSGSPKPKLSKKEKPKRLPTVRRGASGKAEKIAPVDITKPRKKPTVTPKPTKRKQTRTGKKIDKATGRIAIPLVRRGEGGRAVATTTSEREATVRTELPTAGRKTMQPTPAAVTQQPVGTLRRGGQRQLRGFATSHKKVKAAVDALMTHLDNMVKTKGTPEFEQHQKLFDAIHENVSKMDRHGLGISLGQLKHQTLNGGSKPVLGRLHTLIQDRLEEGRMADEANRLRAQQGRNQ